MTEKDDMFQKQLRLVKKYLTVAVVLEIALAIDISAGLLSGTAIPLPQQRMMGIVYSLICVFTGFSLVSTCHMLRQWKDKR